MVNRNGYVYGLDNASKMDFFGIVVHELPIDYEESTTPDLVTLRKLTHIPYDEMFEILTQELFPKYPPIQIVADYSNEKTFTDFLERDFGKNKVMKINFTIPSKQMLKDDGLSILEMGYEFPNPAMIEDPQIAKWVMELIEQLKREQVIFTKSGKISFDHPEGEHNDLAIAWELSIHGCLQYILHKGARPIIATANPVLSERSYTRLDELFPELKGMSNVNYYKQDL
jgi:hypothetical protein